MKRCSVCHSTNIRRSGVHTKESRAHPFHSPYRCQECNARFWVVSRRARLGAVAGGAMALIVGVSFVIPIAYRYVFPSTRTDSVAESPAWSGPTSGDMADRQRIDDILRSQSDLVDRQLRPSLPGETSR